MSCRFEDALPVVWRGVATLLSQSEAAQNASSDCKGDEREFVSSEELVCGA